MIFYFDTSALVKKYVTEKDSESILDIWEKADGISISKIGYADQDIPLDVSTDWQSTSATMIPN